jgi:nucleoside-diphosphate-sugar epimerase
MRIIITGNLGYIGPVVANHFRRAFPEAWLAGLDTGFFANCLTTPLVCPEAVLDCQYFHDVRKVPSEVFTGVDAVVQLAAISNDPMGKTFESVTMEVNHEASLALARKARAAGVKRFVFASSCSVYGFAEDGARDESSNLDPLTAYARSKVATEEGLRSLAGADFQVTCLRFATACGWSPRLRLDLVLNDFVASALASKRIEILSDGTPWRPLIDVQDMARAIEWAVTRNRDVGGDYVVVNAGSNRWNYQVKDLAEAVRQSLPGTQVSVNAHAQPDKRSYRVDFSLFERLAPRHQPKHELATTIQELKAGLGAMNFADPDFRNSRFIRLKALAALKSAGYLDDDLFWKKPAAKL